VFGSIAETHRCRLTLNAFTLTVNTYLYRVFS